MEMFNILKPDILKNQQAINFYFKNMQNLFRIENYSFYKIDDWVSISKLLYELDVSKILSSPELVIEKRKQLLTTILGYNIYYKNELAIMCSYNIEDKNFMSIINQLYQFKKELRKKYVLNTNKYYLKILNPSEIKFELPLKFINLNDIQTDSFIVPYYENPFINSEYDMIFFNKVHFPDPDIEEIKQEINILKENGIVTTKNFIRRI